MKHGSKILVDVRLLSKGISSGIGEYTHNLLESILASDAENEYLLFYNGFRKAPFSGELFRKNSKLVSWRVPNKLFDISTRFLSEPKLERFLDFDAVWSPHFNILATKKPRIVTFHDLSFVHHPDFFSRKQRVWHWLQNCKKQAEDAEKIVAVSEFTKSDLVELFGVKEEKVHVVYSGISGSFRKIHAQNEALLAFRKRHRLEKPFILYFGTLEPRKNVGALVRAFQILKRESHFRDMELIIAGNMGWLYDEVIRTIQSSPAKDDIRLLGKIAREERVLLYNLAELFVYPSFFEGFGFPPLEAQACGVPVVASNRTSLPEILGESALLVDPWRVDELTLAMREVLLQKTVEEKYRELGLKNAAKFSWDSAAEKTLNVISGTRKEWGIITR